MATIQDDAEKDKTIAHFPGWTNAEEGGNVTRFEAPIDIDGITEVGLYLTGLAYVDSADCNVVLELILRNFKGRRRMALARICWRSLKGGHTNQRTKELPPGTPKRLGPTHYHPFDLNWMASTGKMRDGLPNAVPPSQPLKSFEEMLAFAGKVFRISNIGVVSRPEWEQDIFHERVVWND